MHGASPRRQGVFRPASPHAAELLGTPRARVCPKQPRASSLLRSLRRLVSMCARDMRPGPHQCSLPINQGRKGAAASHPAGRRTDATFNHARCPWQIRPAAGLGCGRTALVSVYGPLPSGSAPRATDAKIGHPARPDTRSPRGTGCSGGHQVGPAGQSAARLRPAGCAVRPPGSYLSRRCSAVAARKAVHGVESCLLPARS